RDGTLDVGHDVPFLCAWLLIRIGHHGLFGLFNYVLHLDCKRGNVNELIVSKRMFKNMTVD
ncbi:hypothetical protein, partial [Lactiplantibacillus plantarum]|uniref:hypothetical protein n=1 Tax=Lactiplantibacillus plantarum TaxID=1590 RepID=UPI001C9E4724